MKKITALILSFALILLSLTSCGSTVAESGDVTVVIEVAAAQDNLKEFYLSSGKGDFSYNQYRNYIYGTLEKNSSATTAYYNLLLHAKFGGASEEEVKYYYDALYFLLKNFIKTVKHGDRIPHMRKITASVL